MARFVALLYVAQRALQYFPERIRTAPAAAGLPEAEEVVLDTADGERVIAWHVPPRGDKPVVLYFHGNGGSLRGRVDRFRDLTADGTGLVALSYRGYGGSSGAPTEAGLVERRVGGLCVHARALPGASASCSGANRSAPALRSRSRRKAGRASHPAIALHLGRRCRDAELLVRAGAAVDEGPVSLGFAHRQGHGAGAGTAWRPRQYRADGVGERLYGLINAPKRFVRFAGVGHNDLGAQAVEAAKQFLGEH